MHMIVTLIFLEKIKDVEEETFLLYKLEERQTVEDLKIELTMKFPSLTIDCLELYFGDIILENKKVPQDYGIKHDDKIFIRKNERKSMIKTIFKILYLIVFLYYLYTRAGYLFEEYWIKK